MTNEYKEPQFYADAVNRNVNRYWNDEIDYDRFDRIATAIWKEVREAGYDQHDILELAHKTEKA